MCVQSRNEKTELLLREEWKRLALKVQCETWHNAKVRNLHVIFLNSGLTSLPS